MPHMSAPVIGKLYALKIQLVRQATNNIKE